MIICTFLKKKNSSFIYYFTASYEPNYLNYLSMHKVSFHHHVKEIPLWNLHKNIKSSLKSFSTIITNVHMTTISRGIFEREPIYNIAIIIIKV